MKEEKEESVRYIFFILYPSSLFHLWIATMPIYEYRCTQCGEKFEKLVLNASQSIACPACSSALVEKLFSRFGFTCQGKASSSGVTGGSASSGCSSCTSGNCSSCR